MGWSAGVRSGLCQQSKGLRGAIHVGPLSRPRGHGLYAIYVLCQDLRIGMGREKERVWKRRVIANAAAMHHSRRRGEAKLIVLKDIVGTHAKAASVVPFKVQLEEERVEVGEVVIDPLLTQPFIVTDVLLRQKQHRIRILEAQGTNLPISGYSRASPIALRVGVSYSMFGPRLKKERRWRKPRMRQHTT
eukprot:scaffold29810_cov185-Isochrysis_galbana.AAC.1